MKTHISFNTSERNKYKTKADLFKILLNVISDFIRTPYFLLNERKFKDLLEPLQALQKTISNLPPELRETPSETFSERMNSDYKLASISLADVMEIAKRNLNVSDSQENATDLKISICRTDLKIINRHTLIVHLI